MPAPFTIFNPVTGRPLATFDSNGDLYLHGEVTVSGLISTDGRSILPGSNPAADGAVTSVNGITGAVVLTAASLSALAAANNLSDVASEATARANLGAAPAVSPEFTGSQPTFTTAGGLALTAEGAQASPGPVQVNSTGITSVAGLSVPANDPAAGAVYRVTCFGYFTADTTGGNITIGLTWGGTGGTPLTNGSIVITPTDSLTSFFTIEALVTFTTATACNAMLKWTHTTGGSPGFAGSPHVNCSESAVTVPVSGSELLSINVTLSSSAHVTPFTCLGAIAERVF